jgi:osmoprotectant transport system permease protein
MSWLTDFWNSYGSLILQDLGPHLFMVGVALLIGIVVAVPLGILLTRFPRQASPVIGVVSVFQTIPSLVFFALLLPWLGIGQVPALTVLSLYSLIDAARGQGMTEWEILTMVELPLTAPVIVTGIRLAAVYLVSWATLASLIGAGGLGDLIFSGIDSLSTERLLAGAIPTALLALIIGYLFGRLRRLVTPRGLKAELIARGQKVEVVTPWT